MKYLIVEGKKPFKNARLTGFTLIELLITISIISVLALFIGLFVQRIYLLNTILTDSLSVQFEARETLKAISAQLRSSAPSSTGSYPLAQTNDTTLTFYSDVDNDGLQDQVRYFLNGTTLQKGIIKPSGNPLTYNPANEVVSDVVHYIRNGATPIFTYYDTSYDGTTPPLTQPVNILSVRLIKVTVITDKNPTQSPTSLTLTTQISLRNLKDNL